MGKQLAIFVMVSCSLSGAVRATPQAPTTNPNQTRSEVLNRDHHSLKRQAQELCDAALKDDYTRQVDLTYPKLVELMGGRAKYLVFLQQMMKELQSEDFKLFLITVDDPKQILDVAGQRYAVVPTTMQFKVKEGILIGRAYMIGVSNDGGKNWTFVDSGNMGEGPKLLKILFPAAADKLEIPKAEPPVLQRAPGTESAG
jgi:hypothetical protein